MSEQDQPPTREQIAEALWESARQEGDDLVWTWQYLTERADRDDGDYAEIRAEYYRSADAVLALFPQPTPSEVEVEGSFFAVADLPDVLARHMRALDGAHRREKQHWIDQHEQPAPSAEAARCDCGAPLAVCRTVFGPPAEPVSIADMAPGTTVGPRYEYATTTGPRKAWYFADEPPEGDGWELDYSRGRSGEAWDRFDYHEERYWRRLVTPPAATPEEER